MPSVPDRSSAQSEAQAPAGPAVHPEVSAATLALVTDALAWPLLVLRPDATLLHANVAAHRLLQRGRPLALTAGQRVLPSEAGCQAAFAAALEAASRGSHVPRLLHWPQTRAPGDKGRTRILSATMTTLAAAPGAAAPVLLAVCVGTDTHADIRADTRAFAELHQLSEAESRVLQRLTMGDNSTRAAAALGVAPATVRSQTMSLRRKTGHSSVAALMRALTDMPPLTVSNLPDTVARAGGPSRQHVPKVIKSPSRAD